MEIYVVSRMTVSTPMPPMTYTLKVYQIQVEEKKDQEEKEKQEKKEQEKEIEIYLRTYNVF